MEVSTTPPGVSPAIITLSGSAQRIDTAALLDVIGEACLGGDGIVDASAVVAVTSTLFGVLQATARRLHREGSRLVVVCPEADLLRLRVMRAGRDFMLSASVDGAQWELQRPPSRLELR